MDYDGQRHNFQALQTNMAKKRDEQKISRGRELLEEAKRTYEMLNSELHDELPALHDSRILFLVTNLQTLFSAEQVFHAETAKVSTPYFFIKILRNFLINSCFLFSVSLSLSFTVLFSRFIPLVKNSSYFILYYIHYECNRYF